MKLQPDRFDTQSIAGHGEGWIGVLRDGLPHKMHSSFLIGSHGELEEWPVAGFSALKAADFAPILRLKPELLVFGSGKSLRFCPSEVFAELYAARIGVETMDTMAACRTYNILAQEGRHVMAALILE